MGLEWPSVSGFTVVILMLEAQGSRQEAHGTGTEDTRLIHDFSLNHHVGVHPSGREGRTAPHPDAVPAHTG